MNERPVLIGIGSTLHADEGIGPAVARRVGERHGAGGGWDVLDLGSGGLALLHALAGRPAAVVVDCAFMNCFPGSLRVFEPEAVESLKTLAGFSLHEGDALRIVALSRRLGECPAALRFCGIEPADTAPGLALSRLLAARLDRYAEHVWNLACSLGGGLGIKPEHGPGAGRAAC